MLEDVGSGVAKVKRSRIDRAAALVIIL